ncbi:MAG: hypothetical protein K1X94_05080 [Sandaracinaceae bacterium]|nr:hypothetical protein [Sandaracinaceae bacterium]
MTPDLEALLVEQIRASKKGFRQGGLTMIVLMIVLAGISLVALDGREGQGLAAMCALGVLVGLLLLIPSLGDPAKAKILTTIRSRAQSIVWLFVFTQRGQAAGSWIVMGFDDGTRDRVPAIMGREDEVLRAMAGLCPQATVGYSPAIEAQFTKAPVELRRLPARTAR